METRRFPPVRDYLSGKEQRRLLVLVAALGLVLYAISEVRDPRYWRWLTEEAPPVAVDDASERDGVAEEDRADTLVPLPRFDRNLLTPIQDDAPFRDDEQAAWFGLLATLRDADPRALAEASLGEVTYVQLFDQPEVYRGRIVTLRGIARRVLFMDAPANEEGIRGYYQVVLEPADGSNSPVILYVLELPEGFPTGGDVSAKVAVKGYFFKRWVYTARDRIRSAPVVLAKKLKWRPDAEPEKPARKPPSLLLVISGGAVLAGIILFTVIRRTRLKRSVADADLTGLFREERDGAVEDVEASEPIRDDKENQNGERR